MFRTHKILAIGLALVGWYVLLVQNPVVLLAARIRYNQAIAKKMDLSSGPCLGKITDDWVLVIAHLPAFQCADYSSGKVHHFVEISPKGEVIYVR